MYWGPRPQTRGGKGQSSMIMTQRSVGSTIEPIPMFVREHTRYAVELAVRMKCATWADYLELHTSNLSRGGLFVPSRMSAPVGTALTVELALPDGKRIELRGEVAHVSDGAGGQAAGMGVMFAGLGAEAQRALDAALAQAKAATEKKPAAPPPPKAVKLPPPPPPKSAPAAEPAARAPKFADVVEQALVDELARRVDLRPHEQLGVTLEAGDAEIQEAHAKLRQRYAPGIFARYGASTAAVVKRLNELVDGAHRRLMDPAQRRVLVAEALQPKPVTATPEGEEQRRRGEEARAALRAGIERRVADACAHRDMNRLDDAIRAFEQILELDRKHELARAELAKLRDLKAKRKR